MELTKQKILITGGGSGIGLGLTERLLELGNTVIICGRRGDVLNKVHEKHPAVITRVCDLTDEDDRIDLFQWIQKEHNDLTVLINNAGIQQWMSITDEDFMKRANQEISINIMAPLHLTYLFTQLPKLKVLANVSSGLSFVPLTRTPVYSGTKAFVHSLTLSLRYILKGRGIEVIEIIPPALNTDLGGKGLHDHAPPVSDFIDSIFKQLEEGETELTFGFSDVVSKASQEELQLAFTRLNP
ncbi:MAG: SDR family NAD(P)-dependent oxidoreductase [Bacteroidetes bacterium]|nr:SDR family NAD(P)-dependent oxidoreductase [Bacteroidota bacterium]